MNKYTFMGNGRNKNFYFTFPFFTTADIIVKINGTVATGYGVFCIPGTSNRDFPFTGGHIHFAKAPKPTDIVIIERQLQLNRLIDYQLTEKLTPSAINQDMNYFFELLKDMKNELAKLKEIYAEFTNTESAQTLLTRIDTVIEKIDELGDITTIQTNITNLGISISNLTEAINALSGTVSGHTTTIGGHTTSISALDTFKNEVFDYVIASQAPTSSNNYTWYRKYKSGWVEMGGTIPVRTSTINLPVELSDTNYGVAILYKLAGSNTSSVTYKTASTHTQTTTQFTISLAESTVKGWYISYMSAQN